ncbi:hypothetical protein ID866_11255 [Astraeus odoratus]|nr:hypothetical protein ID866_11255 [Astraeus odoratus]
MGRHSQTNFPQPPSSTNQGDLQGPPCNLGM